MGGKQTQSRKQSGVEETGRRPGMVLDITEKPMTWKMDAAASMDEGTGQSNNMSDKVIIKI